MLLTLPAFSQSYEVESPDKNIRLSVVIDKGISWSVYLKDNVVIEKAEIGIDFLSTSDYGKETHVKKHSVNKVSSNIFPTVPHKDSEIKDEYTSSGRNYLCIRGINFPLYSKRSAVRYESGGGFQF